MKFFKSAFLIAGLAGLLTGCGAIETGNVGVRTQFGQVEQTEVQPGFYTAVLSSVTEYTAKETSVSISDLTPKAADKLMLKDLDVTIFYESNPTLVADFVSHRSGMSALVQGDSAVRPGYVLIDKLARGASSSAVAKFDSQQLHSSREALEAEIRTMLQADLEASDPGMFKITRVNISSLLTDSSIEDSIRKNIQAQNDIATATKRVEVREQEAEANIKLAASLTPAFLQHEYIKAIEKCAENNGCMLIVGGGGNVTPMINMPK